MLSIDRISLCFTVTEINRVKVNCRKLTKMDLTWFDCSTFVFQIKCNRSSEECCAGLESSDLAMWDF
ncbi:hypothetical protein B9Z55_013042 [Caenorhabditis nigoni]|uniref:Uncharacterized protein n=1 Tax=Caenorhabditis nigoni TaxID=1611254 RepID=A0A2G5TZY2_9PELO|nr:hypothetical protein B9Z55_013042 [Caenorhabditis nigoni]